jgi:hypothetical protein
VLSTTSYDKTSKDTAASLNASERELSVEIKEPETTEV